MPRHDDLVETRNHSSGIVEGYSSDETSRAHELLEEFGYIENDNAWTEDQRFDLYDQLSKLAFELADNAMKFEGTDSKAQYSESTVAMCAMEIVGRAGTFSEDTLQRVREAASGLAV